VQPAPGPDNVNWQTLLYRSKDSTRRIFLVTPVIVLLILFPSGIFTVGVASACIVDPPKGLQSFLGGAPAAWFFGRTDHALLSPIGDLTKTTVLLHCTPSLCFSCLTTSIASCLSTVAPHLPPHGVHIQTKLQLTVPDDPPSEWFKYETTSCISNSQLDLSNP